MIGVLILLDAVVVRHIKFTADDVFDALLLARLGKAQGGIHIAVVGDGDGIDVVLDAMIDELLHLDRPVEEAVLGMKMQMDKIGHVFSSVLL